MKTNAAGIELIKAFESLRLVAYKDSVGVWTIGFGHTGSDVWMGKSITEAEAEALLRQDLAHSEAGVWRLAGDTPTTDNQFAAMVSLAFNIGLGNFQKSSVLRWHRRELPFQAANCFQLWNKAGGKILGGLTRRRLAERNLYLSA